METLTPTALTTSDKIKAVQNTGYGTFTLGGREFEIKHLSYDSYLDFCELVPDVISALAQGLELKNDAELGASLQLNPMALDHKALFKIARTDLVRMAWLCCKQSDPKISLADVKALARTPMDLLDVVMTFVRHNDMVKTFADFFQRMLSTLATMAPELNGVIGSNKATAPTE